MKEAVNTSPSKKFTLDSNADYRHSSNSILYKLQMPEKGPNVIKNPEQQIIIYSAQKCCKRLYFPLKESNIFDILFHGLCYNMYKDNQDISNLLSFRLQKHKKIYRRVDVIQ
ncbi:hypothetical protein [uncultured Megasphaera sp.]|uniref:hypothetical protein n=1 Tax=uncultured Megasphaera sp. TaxID=165188 RepID=UPI0025E55793|nr:hypothetical protein [uncultured Megasphaera sp.]